MDHFKHIITIAGRKPKASWCCKKHRGRLFFFMFMLSPLLILAKTNFPLINSAYKYDPAAMVHCQYKLAALEDSVHIYLKVKVAEGTLEQDYVLGYELKDFYGEKSTITVDSLSIAELLIARDKKTYYLKIPLKIETSINLMLLSIKRNDNVAYYDIPLRMEDNFPLSNLILIEGKRNVPVFESYVSTTDSVIITKSFHTTDSSKLYFYQYKHDFSPALPPMASSPDQVAKSLEIDSIFSIASGSKIRLNEEGLYFIQTDTSSLRGISLRVVAPYFPKYGKAEELAQPLIYISTKGEITRLLKASNTKRALDKYWLELIKTPSRAKTVIRQFYDQVEAANRMFTTYKEGWKTDQGMIYILYGPPDEVYFNGQEEQWLYQKDDEISRVKFTFAKIKNIFTDRHFELLRSKSYERFWFGNVELWRKGIKDL